MATAIQLVITNLLIIAMGIFVFILMSKLRKQAQAGTGGAKGAPVIDKELLGRLDSLETKIKTLPAKDDKASYDQIMEMKRNVSDIYDRIESLNGKNSVTDKVIKELQEGLKNIPAGGKGAAAASAADYQPIINEAVKKEINKAMNQHQESISGANEEIICRIGTVEQMYNKMAESMENNLNEMKKQADEKIIKIENSLKKIEESGQEQITKSLLKEQKEKLDGLKKELREEFKGGGVDEEAFQKVMKNQDKAINTLKETVTESLAKYDKQINEINEKEKSDEKMIDFIDANLYEIKKRLDALNKK